MNFSRICITFLFTVNLLFLSSGTGMAIIAEGDFEGIANDTELRADGPGQDWYESREDDPSLLLHDTTPISGHTGCVLRVRMDPAFQQHFDDRFRP